MKRKRGEAVMKRWAGCLGVLVMMAAIAAPAMSLTRDQVAAIVMKAKGEYGGTGRANPDDQQRAQDAQRQPKTPQQRAQDAQRQAERVKTQRQLNELQRDLKTIEGLPTINGVPPTVDGRSREQIMREIQEAKSRLGNLQGPNTPSTPSTLTSPRTPSSQPNDVPPPTVDCPNPNAMEKRIADLQRENLERSRTPNAEPLAPNRQARQNPQTPPPPTQPLPKPMVGGPGSLPSVGDLLRAAGQKAGVLEEGVNGWRYLAGAAKDKLSELTPASVKKAVRTAGQVIADAAAAGVNAQDPTLSARQRMVDNLTDRALQAIPAELKTGLTGKLLQNVRSGMQAATQAVSSSPLAQAGGLMGMARTAINSQFAVADATATSAVGELGRYALKSEGVSAAEAGRRVNAYKTEAGARLDANRGLRTAAAEAIAWTVGAAAMGAGASAEARATTAAREAAGEAASAGNVEASFGLRGLGQARAATQAGQIVNPLSGLGNLADRATTAFKNLFSAGGGEAAAAGGGAASPSVGGAYRYAQAMVDRFVGGDMSVSAAQARTATAHAQMAGAENAVGRGTGSLLDKVRAAEANLRTPLERAAYGFEPMDNVRVYEIRSPGELRQLSRADMAAQVRDAEVARASAIEGTAQRNLGAPIRDPIKTTRNGVLGYLDQGTGEFFPSKIQRPRNGTVAPNRTPLLPENVTLTPAQVYGDDAQGLINYGWARQQEATSVLRTGGTGAEARAASAAEGRAQLRYDANRNVTAVRNGARQPQTMTVMNGGARSDAEALKASWRNQPGNEVRRYVNGVADREADVAGAFGVSGSPARSPVPATTTPRAAAASGVQNSAGGAGQNAAGRYGGYDATVRKFSDRVEQITGQNPYGQSDATVNRILGKYYEVVHRAEAAHEEAVMQALEGIARNGELPPSARIPGVTGQERVTLMNSRDAGLGDAFGLPQSARPRPTGGTNAQRAAYTGTVDMRSTYGVGYAKPGSPITNTEAYRNAQSYARTFSNAEAAAAEVREHASAVTEAYHEALSNGHQYAPDVAARVVNEFMARRDAAAGAYAAGASNAATAVKGINAATNDLINRFTKAGQISIPGTR